MIYALAALLYCMLFAAFHWLLNLTIAVSLVGAGIVVALVVGALLAMLWYDDVKDLNEW